MQIPKIYFGAQFLYAKTNKMTDKNSLLESKDTYTSASSLLNVTREDVISQLQQMGYKDVPDAIVEEFLEELRASAGNTIQEEEKKGQRKLTFEEEGTANNLIQDEKHPEIMIHPVYSSPVKQVSNKAMSPVATQPPFVALKKQQHFAESEDEDDTENYNDSSDDLEEEGDSDDDLAQILKRYIPPKDAAKIPNTIQLTKTMPPHLPPKKLSLPQQQDAVPISIQPNNNNNSHSIKPATTPRPASPMSARSQPSSPTTASPRTSFAKRPQAVDYRKKVHDPVARYQKMQQAWEKDKFLRDSKTQHKALRMQVRKEMTAIRGQNVYT